jgi:hypothetical protein
MSTEIQLYRPPPRDLAQATFDLVPNALELAKQIAPTEFVPIGLRNNVPATFAAILTGAEVGLPPMASLSQIFVINGRPGMYGTGMRALILSHGHHVRFGDYTNTRVQLIGRRRGEDNETSVTWTLDDAVRAQLAGKPLWKQYPRSMLTGRVTGELARAIFADVILGIPYTVEELQDGFVGDESVRALPPPEPPGERGPSQDKPKRTARRTRRQTASPPAPPLPQEQSAPPAPPLPGEETPAAPVVDTGGPGPQAPAGEPAPGETLTMAQQIAMHCRAIGIERADLLRAVTGKTSGREITREQAVQVLEAAKAIVRGEARLLELDGAWQVVPVDNGAEPGGQDDLFGGGRS